jgi:hypothetical protein
MATRRRIKKEPAGVVAVLTAAAHLPMGDPLRFAAALRLNELIASCKGVTLEVARRLGVTARTAQRLRAAYGVSGERGSRAG